MDIHALLARARDVRKITVTVDGIAVTLREPTLAANAEYARRWTGGQRDEAVASLLHHCIVDEAGQSCLSVEQAQQLALAGSELTRPLIDAINSFAASEKKPHAPGADAVQDQPAAGAPSV